MTPRIILVLDLSRLAWAQAAAHRPHVVVQLRDRASDARSLVEAARSLTARGVEVVVNDRADICRAAGARGVHLPEQGLTVEDARAAAGAQALIGVSLHLGSDLSGRARGADYAVFGPIFATPGKGEGVGLAALAVAASQVPCPLLAIGGVDPASARATLDAGAAGIAVIRAADRLADLERVMA